MKRKARISRIFLGAVTILVIYLLTPNLNFAQCGNYFKTNYRAIDRQLTAVSPRQVSLDDWTGDGKSDFWNLRRNPTTLILDVVIFPSKPTGYWDFDNPIIYTTTVGNLGSDLKIIDFDSDGKMDILFGSNSYQFLRNNGNGTMTTTPLFTDPDAPTSNTTLGFTDLNGDNLLDWIYSVFLGGNTEFRYQLQNPNGSFGGKTTILSTPYSSNKRLGDFDGDGRLDIIHTAFVNNTNIYVLIKNLGGGNFQVGSPVASDLSVFPQPNYSNPVRDFNNDGRDDILSRGIIFYGQVGGTFNRVQATTGTGSMLPVELNGDNNLDIIEFGVNSYATNISNGTGGFTRTVYSKDLGALIDSVLIFEDFNVDGKADLYDASTNTNIHTYNIFGERVVSIKENLCQFFGETKQANFDGNRNFDVATWNPNTGNWSSKNSVWGPATDVNTRVGQWGSATLSDVPSPGDFDGDGKTDYAVYRNNTGIWYINKSSDNSWFAFGFGLPGDIPVPNDYDGGGKTDIAVFRPSSGIWYIWISETQQFRAQQFGANGDKPVPADYDGDGKTDIAVYRPSQGNWYLLKSSNGNFAAVQWGITTDKPLPADFDGDSRADIAINRDGVWWILRSSDNSYGSISWGAVSDLPMPVYRNSVTADLVVYRPSNNSWYSYDSRNLQGFAMGSSQDSPIYFGLPNY